MAKRSLQGEIDQPTTAVATVPEASNAVSANVMDRLGTVDGCQGTVPTGDRTPYIKFAFPNPQDPSKWVELAKELPGVQQSDPMLIREDGTKRIVRPLRFHLMLSVQYWADGNEDGSLRAAWKERPAGNLREQHIDDYFEGVILALVNSASGIEVVPATVRVRSGMAKGFYKVLNELRAAASPDWASRSAAHKATLTIPRPALRFVASVTPRMAPSKTTGRRYGSTEETTCEPNTNAMDFQTVRAALDDKDFLDRLGRVVAAFDRRCADVDRIAAKTSQA